MPRVTYKILMMGSPKLLMNWERKLRRFFLDRVFAPYFFLDARTCSSVSPIRLSAAFIDLSLYFFIQAYAMRKVYITIRPLAGTYLCEQIQQRFDVLIGIFDFGGIKTGNF